MAEKVYKWRDENGKLHFSTVPPAQHDVENVDLHKQPRDMANAHRKDNYLRKQQRELNRKHRAKERHLSNMKYRGNGDGLDYEDERCKQARRGYRDLREEGIVTYNKVKRRKEKLEGPDAQIAFELAKYISDAVCNWLITSPGG